MNGFGQERLMVGQQRRVAKLWFRWAQSQGLEYPRSIEGTWTRIWELVTIMPRIEDANTNYLAQLLAPTPPPPTGDVMSPCSLATAGYSSVGSNSVTGSIRKESEE